MTFLLLAAAVLPLWQDMQATSVNAETKRTEVIYYENREDALVKGFRESSNYLDLNGVWDFKYYEDYHNLPEPSEEVAWDKIKVPGNWEVQGYGYAYYTNIQYDFCPVNPQPPQLPDIFPGGVYHRTFTVPSEWAGRQVFLNLCATKSGTYVYVNGKEVGYGEDSKSLHRYNITEFLKPGENHLFLKIYRYTTASYVEDQDFWRISGIERDVYLSSEKADTGFDFSVISTLDQDLTTGIFKLRMRSNAPVEVFYELLDKDGEAVADAIFEFSGSMATVTDTIPAVRKWTAETPELYTLLLRVNGEYTRFHVGFRRLEVVEIPDQVGNDGKWTAWNDGNTVTPDQIGSPRMVHAFLVNGQPVKFKGVNLHEHNPYTGHYTTKQNILEDLLLMKKANINAIRTCHYPQPREFYELCDSLGFYVYDECNIESHGMGYTLEKTLGNNPEWLTKHIDRTLNMYRRTANYPCVTILSLGNEAGNGVNFYETYKILKALEKNGQNRPVVYERAEFEHNTDFINPMYPDTKWLKKMGETYSARPVVLCEYTHAMGNSNGSLDLMWEQFYSHAHLQGGFIWDWVDQGLYDAERGWTYGGDYGENPPSDANFCCNGIVNPDRDPHPAFYEVKHIHQNLSVSAKDLENGVFQVFNRYYFTTVSGVKLKWWVERDGKRILFAKGKVKLNVAPQEAQEFKLRLPRMKKPGQYRIFFTTAESCDEVLIKDTSAPKKAVVKGRVGFTDGDTQIVVRGNKVELVFNKEWGCVKSWKVAGKDVVDPSFGIRPNFWRAPIDNDYGNGAPARTAIYKEAWKPIAVKAEDAGGAVRILVKGQGVRASEAWTVFPDGTLKIEVETAAQPLGDVEIPRLGIRFRVADDDFSYFGRGPVENYWDRISCTFKSVFHSSASKEYYPYVRPQECGHHTDVNWLSIGGLTVQGLFEFNALRQTIEDLDGGIQKSQTHITDVPFNSFTEVCIDYRMSGLGGYDSWGSRPEPAYTLWSNQSYSYSFTLRPSGKNAQFVY
ncbi:MAG: beta-galactosidase [Bacteroidales bacterium]|nr:beta-galactosidase [Bacteroidales bacterium]